MKLTEDQENIRVECKIQDNFPAETIIILQDEHMQTSKHDVFLLHDVKYCMFNFVHNEFMDVLNLFTVF